jgi:hypothetical protein
MEKLKDLTKKVHDKSVIPLIVMAVLILITICVTFLYPRKEYQEWSYNITAEKSVYSFPWWNITLLAHEDTPKIVEIQLYYGEQQVLEKYTVGISMRDGDRLTVTNMFNVHIVSGEIFTMYLYFEHNDFMRFNLTLPVEETG